MAYCILILFHFSLVAAFPSSLRSFFPVFHFSFPLPTTILTPRLFGIHKTQEEILDPALPFLLNRLVFHGAKREGFSFLNAMYGMVRMSGKLIGLQVLEYFPFFLLLPFPIPAVIHSTETTEVD